jgi:fructose-1,6-bisphosphatase I
LITLEEHIIKTQSRFPQASGDLTHLLLDITLACKFIAREINQSSIKDLHDVRRIRETASAKMKRLETFASDQMHIALSRTPTSCLMITDAEGSEAERLTTADGKYIVVIDPLDGTPNIEFNASVATTFSVFRRQSPRDAIADPREALQPGYKQVVGGYVLYGTSTMLVFTTEGTGVHFFTMDPGIGEFILSSEDVRIPSFKKAFSMNTGLMSYWDEGPRAYLEHVTEQEYSFRYGGSMVADIHRILMEGGLFAYPADNRFPRGKLHLMYKCNPLSFVVEQAGGKASNGSMRILDIQPLQIHQTTPIFIGSPKNVDEVLNLLSVES